LKTTFEKVLSVLQALEDLSKSLNVQTKKNTRK